MPANDNPQGRIGCGRKIVTTAGTKVQLSTTSVECAWIQIVAETDNTGIITFGDSEVVGVLASRKGVPLNAGDSEVIPVDNLTDIYLDTTVNGDGVTYIYGY